MSNFSVRFALLFAVLCCTATELEGAFTAHSSPPSPPRHSEHSFFSHTVHSSPPPPPTRHGEHSFFFHAALLPPILSHLGFHELATAAAPSLSDAATIASSAWIGPSTIFAPSDDLLRSCFSCSVPNLLSNHAVPGVFTIDYLRKLAFGTRIETLSPGRCITVTAESVRHNTSHASAPKIFIGGVEITQPDLFNNGMVVVHGIQGFVSPLSPFSCDDVERMTSLSFPFHPDRRSGHHLRAPAVHTTIMSLMLRDAMLRLRFSNLALAMKIKNAELVTLSNMTVFAVDDVSIFSGSHSYIRNVRCHIVPNHYLTIADLEKLPVGTALPTLNCSWLLRRWTRGSDPYVESLTGVAYGLLPNVTHMDIAYNNFLATGFFILLFIAYRFRIRICSGILQALKYFDSILYPAVAHSNLEADQIQQFYLSNFPDISVGSYVEGMKQEVHLSTGYELFAGGEGTYKKVLQVVAAFLFSSPTTLVPNLIWKKKSSSGKLRVENTQKFKRESRGEQPRHVPRKAALLIGMTYENKKNKLSLLKSSHAECHDLNKILRKYYDFTQDNIITMTEKEKNQLHKPTKDNIRWEIRKLLQNAIAGDTLFLYVTGHGEYVKGKAAIASGDDKPLLESYWSGLGKKIPSGVTLTAVMNTCYGGKLFENANVEGKGKIIAYSPGGANESILEGHFYHRILAPIMKKGRGKSNQEVYRKITRSLKVIDPNADPTFHCPQEVLTRTFV